MALAKDSTLTSGITVLPSPGQVGVIDDAYHPGGQGNNIYQLMRVVRDGRPHLVGSVSKGNGFIVDFTTGEVLYDFHHFGVGPYLGNDSYCCATKWTNPADGITRYYFGGWFKAPTQTPVSGQQNHTNKYGYVVETADFKTWNVVLKDKAQAWDSWQAEVSDLVPTNDGLYIFRGDTQAGGAGTLTAATAVGATSLTATMTFPQQTYPAGTTVTLDHGTASAETVTVTSVTGSSNPYTINVTALTKTHAVGATISDAPLSLNQGVWKYTGGATETVTPTLARVSTNWILKGLVYMDEVIGSVLGQGSVHRWNPANNDTAGAVGNYTSTIMQGTGGATRSESGLYRSGFGILAGLLVHGTDNGFYIGDLFRDAGNTRFIPLAITPNSGGSIVRSVGWRSVIKQIAGGVVFAANIEAPGNTDAGLSFLYWYGPGGTIRVLDVGGSFGAIEVYDDKVYYGVSNGHHSGSIGNYKLDNPMLASIPVNQLKNGTPPAFSENISYANYNTTYGIAGLMGGYPTLGYRKATLVVTSSVAGNLTPVTINAGKSSVATGNVGVSYPTIALTANAQQIIDLTPYLDGSILFFKFSATAAISARIAFQ